MMNKSSELINKVLQYLNTNVEYALLRNYEGLPDNNRSRDIDIIISNSELLKHKKAILDIIIDSNWKIFTYLDNSRLVTYVCGLIDGDSVELVQWDFFTHTSIHGVYLMEAKELLKNRSFNGSLYHVSKEDEFLDKYLYNRSVGAKYPEKYLSVRDHVATNEYVCNKLKETFGISDIEILDKTSGKRLMLRAFWGGFKRNPVKAIFRVARAEWYYVKNYTLSNVGPSIGFTGPDGSGKTTVIDKLIDRMSSVFEKATVYMHFRPLIIPNIGEVAHSSGVKRDVDRDYSNPHRGGKTGILSSVIRLCYYSTDYILGYFIKVKPSCKITRLVIFDRYFTDVIADSRRSRIHLNLKFLYWFGRAFIPSLDYNILLTADADVILARKQELSREGIDGINLKLDYLATKRGYYLVKNDGTADEAVNKILVLIFEEQHKKNLKRI